MTYRELARSILNMSEEQMDSDVTVLDVHDYEFYPARHILFNIDHKELDKDHPYMSIKR